MAPCVVLMILTNLIGIGGALALIPVIDAYSSSLTNASTRGRNRLTTSRTRISSSRPTWTSPASPLTRTTRLCLVTEEEVLEAVEKAEALWAQALEARKTANALSDRAEEEAEAAATTAMDVENMLKDKSSAISLEKIAQADKAAKSNIDASGMVNKALEAEEEANRLEALAEEALRVSEEKLTKHLEDVPDSPLAD